MQKTLIVFRRERPYELPLVAAERVEGEDRHMADGLEVSARRVRRWRSISEKLKIVQESLQPGDPTDN